MKSITAIFFLLAFYIRLSSACVFFYSNITNARDFAATGSLMNEGERVCTWNSKLSKTEQFWLDCNAGHTAFVTKDFKTLAYAHNNKNYRIALAFERINTEVELIYGNEKSCYCDGPRCKFIVLGAQSS
jgi:hypothetical protein